MRGFERGARCESAMCPCTHRRLLRGWCLQVPGRPGNGQLGRQHGRRCLRVMVESNPPVSVECSTSAANFTALSLPIALPSTLPFQRPPHRPAPCRLYTIGWAEIRIRKFCSLLASLTQVPAHCPHHLTALTISLPSPSHCPPPPKPPRPPPSTVLKHRALQAGPNTHATACNELFVARVG